MSLPNYLAKIKSSGIYRFVWDKSEVTMNEVETLRLVVGYSEKGPFNTPVYIRNEGEFKTLFGGINKKLEKRGVFFHRLALQTLKGGRPILALNLRKFTTTGEDAEKVEYAYTTGAAQALKKMTGVNVDQIYDTTRFWTLNPEVLADLPTTGTDKSYMTIAATDALATSCSVFMRPCASTGYDVTIKTWYANLNEDVPDYLLAYENMQVADFFAEMYVFKGEFNQQVAQSDELKKYFRIVTVGSTNKVVLAPSITDAFGTEVDTLDALAGNECSGFIQKYQGIMLPYFKNVSGAYISLDLLFNSDHSKHKMMMYFNEEVFEDETAYDMTKLATRGWDLMSANDVKYIAGATVANYAGVNVLSDIAIMPKAHIINPMGTDSKVPASYTGSDVDFTVCNLGTQYTPATTDPVAPASGNWEVSGSKIILHDTIPSGQSAKTKYIETYEKLMSEGSRYLINNDSTGLVPVVATLVRKEKTGSGDDEILTLTFDREVGLLNDGNSTPTIYFIARCDKMLMHGTTTSPIYLKGYTANPNMTKPANGTPEAKLAWQQKILSVLSTNGGVDGGYPGLVEALTNRVDCDYRYIVDTFESFIENELKKTLSCLAKKKDNCVLLSNFPAIKTFIASTNTKFVDENGVFRMKYVKAGGNSMYPMSVRFCLPTEENGASWCSFNTPVIYSDGTVKTTVPVAGLVSNNFMDKYESRQPYYVVAGPKYGKLIDGAEMIGPDYIFTKDDRDILEPMGVNCTVYALRKGTYINSNQTAKQSPVTALSKLNVRELVIYLQDAIEELLQNNQWELNTDTLRNLIEKKADTICENVKLNNGLYAFKNTCDRSNNTDEVIANEMIILSTEIEPAYAAGKMVQELTIRKTGEITAKITQ